MGQKLINQKFVPKEVIAKEIEDQFSTSLSSKWVKIDLLATKLLRTFYLDVFKVQEEGEIPSKTPIDELFAIKLATLDDEELIILVDCPNKNILLE
mgnify:CR=1 FL=1